MPFQNSNAQKASSVDGLSTEQLDILESLSVNTTWIEKRPCKCRLNYLNSYKEIILAPFEYTEYINFSDTTYVTTNNYYEVGTVVKSIVLPVQAEDQDLIILQDFARTWGDIPLRVYNFSESCYGIELNKPGMTAVLRYNGGKSEWEFYQWSFNTRISPQVKRIKSQIVTYDQGRIFPEYYARIVGTGYSTYVDIDNIFTDDDIHQIYFYPTKGEFIVDIRAPYRMLESGEEITYQLGTHENFEYYRVYYANMELIPNSYIRQRLKFDQYKIFDLKDGDIFLRDIHVVLISTETNERDPIELGEGHLGWIRVLSYDTLLEYEEEKDYIVHLSTGEVIPTVRGRIRPGEKLLIRYAI